MVTRRELIDILMEDIDNWDEDALRAYVEAHREAELQALNNEELEQEAEEFAYFYKIEKD